MNYLKRLVYRSEGVKLNPLMHIFFFMSLVFGLAFSAAPEFTGANETMLYELTRFANERIVLSVWGAALILTTILNTVMLMTRARVLGGFTALLGFMCWLYAAIIYSFDQFWLGLFGLAIPNIMFWFWYYLWVKAYHRNPPLEV